MPEVYPEFNPEQQYKLETTARFYEIAQGVGTFYGLPKLAECSGITFPPSHSQREDQRSDALRYPDAASGDFAFEMADYGRFYEEFSDFLELSIQNPTERQRLTRDLYIGVGIANFVAHKHIFDPAVPSTKQRLDAVKRIFTNKNDLAVLFDRVTDNKEKVPMVEHLHDKEVMRTNGYRVGLRYLFDSMPDILAPLDLLSLQAKAITTFRDLVDSQADQYVDISVFGFGMAPEQGEKTFVYRIPSWLMAMAAAPLKPTALKHLHNRAWRQS